MSGRVQDKLAFVTGGASGVGLETAQLLVREGARVAIADIDDAGAQKLAAQLNAELGSERTLAVHLDVASEADWAAAIERAQQRFGALDILINNAGILIAGDIETATAQQFRKIMQVNAESCFLGTQQGVRAMRARGGAIVNMASVSSWLPVEGYLAYSASKAAVAAVTRAAALYCRKHMLDIRINSLHPDGIYTPMMKASLPPGVPPEAIVFDPKTNPKGRATMPEHIARVMLFLASDEARAINGADIRADSAILGMGL